MRRKSVQRALAGLLAVGVGAGCQVVLGLGGELSPEQACTDGAKDGNETDVDCGGGTCLACANGKRCKVGADCKDEACIHDVCTAPTCHDGVKNGEETGMDCGGPTCPKCSAGEGCLVASDCVSGICTGTVCQPSCTDNVKDGNETDIDCGGGMCPGCAVGKVCKQNTDCQGGVCTSGKCADFLVWAEAMGGTSATDAAALVGVGLDSGGNAVLAANFQGAASLGGSAYDTGDAMTEGFAFGRYDPNGAHLWDAGVVTGVAGASQSVHLLAVGTPASTAEFAAIGTYGPTGVNFGDSVTLPNVSPPTGEAFYALFDTSGPVLAQSFGNQAGILGGAFDGVTFSATETAVFVVGSGQNGAFSVADTSVNDGDMFIARLDDPEWGQTFNDGGGNSDLFVSVSTNPTGNVLIAGQHDGVLDFGGGPRNSATDGRGFVLELSSLGAYAWDKSFGAMPEALAIDGMGDIVLCGKFTGSVDFGAGALTSANGSVFVAKLDPTGKALWSKAFPIGGPNLLAPRMMMTTDVAGDVLLGVNLKGDMIDFGGASLAGAVLVAKLNPSGAVLWSRGFGALGKMSLQGIAAYDGANVLVAGTFQESLDFGSKTLSTTAAESVFLARLSLP